MPDLIEFLRARLDEDEAGARAAATYSAEWCTGDDFNETVLLAADDDFGHTFDSVYGQIAPHIARHDPARVLAEVEAKRRILERIEALTAHNRVMPSRDIGMIIEGIVIDLVLPYADSPGFQDEWRT